MLSNHDQRVRRLAIQLRSAGCSVKAAIPGYLPPDSLAGRKPDIIAWKGGRVLVIEVETPESLSSNHTREQVSTLRQFCSKKGWAFRVSTTDGRNFS